MRAALEIILAFLSGIGLLGLGWLLSGRLALPEEDAVLVVAGRGNGENLEQAVTGFLWLRDSGFFRGSVVIADDGLSESGRAAARLLSERAPGIVVCLSDGLADSLGELLENREWKGAESRYGGKRNNSGGNH